MFNFLIRFNTDFFFIATECVDFGQAVDQLREAYPSALIDSIEQQK